MSFVVRSDLRPHGLFLLLIFKLFLGIIESILTNPSKSILILVKYNKYVSKALNPAGSSEKAEVKRKVLREVLNCGRGTAVVGCEEVVLDNGRLNRE